MEITDAKLDDVGKYTAKATNQFGVSETTVEVGMVEKHAVEETVTIETEETVESAPEKIEQVTEEVVETETTVTETKVTETTELKQAPESESSEAETAESSAEDQPDVAAANSPKFDLPPEPQVVTTGDTIKLTCKVAGRLSWFSAPSTFTQQALGRDHRTNTLCFI